VTLNDGLELGAELSETVHTRRTVSRRTTRYEGLPLELDDGSIIGLPLELDDGSKIGDAQRFALCVMLALLGTIQLRFCNKKR
jgi:hypothetical protein